jgi:hypothetical protein
MPNNSLKNALSFSMSNSSVRLASDSLFSATANGAQVFWKVDFGARTNVGYVVVFGYETSSNG